MWSTGRPKRGRGAAFTLLELILVMVIAAGLLALAAPSLRAFSARRKVHHAGMNFLTLCKYARLAAATEGRVYRLVVSPQEGTFFLAAQQQAVFVPVETSWGRKFRVPEGVALQWIEPADWAARPYLQFDPRGRSNPAQLAFVGQDGTVVTVLSRSPSERFRILEGSAEELYELQDERLVR